MLTKLHIYLRKVDKLTMSGKTALLMLILTLLATGLNLASASEYPTPNFDLYSRSYRDLQWGNTAIELPSDVKGGAGVKVAVVDTGIDGTHPFLFGRVDSGWDFVDNLEIKPNSNSDDGGHGTHVAGIIGAYGGLQGVAPLVRFIPVKVLNSSGGGSDESVSNGVDYAVKAGADVINLSLGAQLDPFENPDSKTCKAISNAYNSGVGVIVAAGNDGAYGNALSNLANCTGSFNVGAVDQQLKRSYFSNFDASVNIVAPGSGILSTLPSTEVFPYQAWSGTSMATPFVTGAYALKLSENPTLKPLTIYNQISASALDLGPKGKDPQYGAGLLNVAKLLSKSPSSLKVIKSRIAGKSSLTIKSIKLTDSALTFDLTAPLGATLTKAEIIILKNGYTKINSSDPLCQELFTKLYQIFDANQNGNDYTNQLLVPDSGVTGDLYSIIREALPKTCKASDVNRFMTASFRPYSVSTAPVSTLKRFNLPVKSNKVSFKYDLKAGSFIFVRAFDKTGREIQAIPVIDFTDNRTAPKEEVNKIDDFKLSRVGENIQVDYKTSRNTPVSISVADYQSGYFNYVTSNSSPFIIKGDEARGLNAHYLTVYLSTGTDSAQRVLKPLYGFDYDILTAGESSILIRGKSTLCNENKSACQGALVQLISNRGEVIAESRVLDSLGYFFNIEGVSQINGYIKSGENRSEDIKWSR